jgi:hypothetical protein
VINKRRESQGCERMYEQILVKNGNGYETNIEGKK